jgi:hypothetical protein
LWWTRRSGWNWEGTIDIWGSKNGWTISSSVSVAWSWISINLDLNEFLSLKYHQVVYLITW